MKKMQPISMIENAIGIAKGILHEADTFLPVIWDPPRFIQDSRVYPRLYAISSEHDQISFASGLTS